jgi:hypothetical protein
LPDNITIVKLASSSPLCGQGRREGAREGNSIAADIVVIVVVPLIISKVNKLTSRFQIPALEWRRWAHFHPPSLHVGIEVSALDGKSRRQEAVLIEEDFTVWRDSERCSSVLLGIYLGESLGESC